MKVKKKINNIILIILNLIFIKSPLVIIIKNIITKRGYHSKNSNYFFNILKKLFWQNYFCKLKDPYYQRKIVDRSLMYGNGVKWAKIYFKSGAQNFSELRKRKVGNLSEYESNPVFTEIYKFLKKKKNLFFKNDNYSNWIFFWNEFKNIV